MDSEFERSFKCTGTFYSKASIHVDQSWGLSPRSAWTAQSPGRIAQGTSHDFRTAQHTIRPSLDFPTSIRPLDTLKLSASAKPGYEAPAAGASATTLAGHRKMLQLIDHTCKVCFWRICIGRRVRYLAGKSVHVRVPTSRVEGWLSSRTITMLYVKNNET